MSQHKLLCYKISYCLGATEDGLNWRFNTIHQAAKQINYFGNKIATNTFRMIARVYFTAIRNYEHYNRTVSFSKLIHGSVAKEVETSSIEFEKIFRSAGDIEGFLNTLRVLANDQIAGMYSELKLGLNFSDFNTLMSWPDVSRQKIRQVQFMLKKLPPDFTIYFYNSEILNVDVLKMLNSDVYLVRRLDCITGTPLKKCLDTSELFDVIKMSQDPAFLHLKDLDTYTKIYVDGSQITEDLRKTIDSAITESTTVVEQYPNIESCLQNLGEDALPDTHLIITHCNDEYLDALRSYSEKASFLITMPVPRMTYRRILQREWVNTYLLSMRQDGETEESKSAE